MIFHIFNQWKKSIIGTGIGFIITLGLGLLGNYLLTNSQNGTSHIIITPDIKLFAVISLTLFAGLFYIGEKRNYRNIGHVWGLLTWFTIIIMPLTAVPSALEYWGFSEYGLLFAMGVVFLSWVLIAQIFDKPKSSDIKYYDLMMYGMLICYLMMGGVFFWLFQSIR